MWRSQTRLQTTTGFRHGFSQHFEICSERLGGDGFPSRRMCPMSIRSASVGRRRRGRHAIPRLREKILTSALELFAHNGFEKVTADELAAGAQVGKGSVYRQFGSKEGLYAAAISAGFRRLRSQIERALEEGRSFPDQISTIVRHFLISAWDRGRVFA